MKKRSQAEGVSPEQRVTRNGQLISNANGSTIEKEFRTKKKGHKKTISHPDNYFFLNLYKTTANDKRRGTPHFYTLISSQSFLAQESVNPRQDQLWVWQGQVWIRHAAFTIKLSQVWKVHLHEKSNLLVNQKCLPTFRPAKVGLCWPIIDFRNFPPKSQISHPKNLLDL